MTALTRVANYKSTCTPDCLGCNVRGFHSFLSSVQSSFSVVSDSLWPRGLQHTRPPCPSPTTGAYSNSSPSSRWCHLFHPLSSPSPPAFNLSQDQGLFQWVSSLNQVAKVLEFQLQHQSFQWKFRTDFLLDWLVGSPYSPRDASLATWLNSISSSPCHPRGQSGSKT